MSRGGRTVPENMQLLSVNHHRAKSAHESRGSFRVLDVNLELDARELYIFTRADLQFPADKRTPLEAITHGCGLSVLSYTKVDRSYAPTEHEVDYMEMLNRFSYTPT